MDDYILYLGQRPFLIPGYAIQVFTAAFFGFLIGCERAWKGKAASVKTFSALSAGSCIFTILSIEAAPDSGAMHYDVTRIAAQVVTGVGFLGGGVIFKTLDRVEGTTTAALVWMTAAIGMACGFGRIGLVLWAFFIATIFHSLSMILHATVFERIRKRNGDQSEKVEGSNQTT